MQIAQAGPYRLMDSHVHLQCISTDLDAVLQRAAGEGIQRFICNGSRETDWEKVAELAKKYSQIIPSFGLHPSFAADGTPRWTDSLRHFLTAMPSAVGEIGLDRSVTPFNKAAQEKVFLAQIRLAKQLKRPVMVHCVRAWDWLLHVFKQEPPLPQSVVLHAFKGSVSIVQTLSREYDVFFSLAGNTLSQCSEPRVQSLRAIPRERLLLETDSPFLPLAAKFKTNSLPPKADQPDNEPANLRIINREIAILLDLPESELASITWQNGQTFLRQWGLEPLSAGTDGTQVIS